MNKHLLLIIVLILLSAILLAGNSNRFALLNEHEGITKIQFELEDLELSEVEDYTKLTAGNSGFTAEYGMPQLPLFSTLIQIDPNKTYDVDYSVILSHKLYNVKVLPFQDNSTGQDPVVISRINEDFYSSEKTYPEKIISVSEPLVMRGLQLLNISIIPFRYFPEKRELEIFDEVEINIRETGNRENPFFKPMPRSRIFEKLYESLIVNYAPSNREEPYQQPSILYICGGNSETNPYFRQLVEWRHKRGYVVYTVSTSETGSSADQIKEYIQNAYNSYRPPPEFVGLVGDVGGSFNVATYYEDWGHNTYGNLCEGDQPYAQLDGEDLFPEIIIGRLSIRSATDLATIAGKILNYEKATFLDDLLPYYEQAALVGDPSASGISTVITNEYIEEIMTAYEMEDIRTNFGSGNYPSWMQNQLTEGVLYFNYRGYVGISGFGNQNIQNANNGYKLTFATMITCGPGSFAEENTCLTEKFLRAGSASNPKGGVAAVGTATWNTHTLFNNIVDMGIYDGIFTKGLEYAGAVLAHGKLALYNAYPSNPYNWVNAFTQWNNLMGDPATSLWTDTPKILIVEHPYELTYGTNFVDIVVRDENGNPIKDAMITLIKGNDEIFTSRFTGDNGNETIDLGYSSDGDIAITVTKQNCKPYEGTLSIISDGAIVNVDNQAEIQIIDNGNGVLNPGETVDLLIPLKNFGTEIVNGVEAKLTATSNLVTILDSTVSYGAMDPGESGYGDGFTFLLSASAINWENLGLRLYISDNDSHEWNAVITINVFGSLLTIEGNGFIEPGETRTIPITLKNYGSIPVTGVSAELTYEGNLLEITDNFGSWGNISPGESSESQDSFVITAGNDIVNGTIIPLALHIQSEEGYDRTEFFHIQIGVVSVSDPLGPDLYGYYIYDSGDTGYDLAPVYDWIEINPSYGGQGTSLNMSDNGNGIYSNSSVYLNLPFTFRFYGIDYDEITVCSNGWIAFGHSEMESFRNYSVPGPGGPSPMLAVFWDDLKTTEGGNVYYYTDDSNGSVIIEWSDMRTQNQNSLESFQIILYDNPVIPYGDGEIKIQYKVFNNTSAGNYGGYPPIHGGYCTIGTENHLSNDGLEYTFSEKYPTAAMRLDDETALFVTTQPPLMLPAPALTYTPGSFDFTVEPGGIMSGALNISNTGESGSILFYNIEKTYPPPESPFTVPGGGPDGFGNYWSDSDLEASIEYQWEDISGIGTLLTFEHNDYASGPVEIGFNFPFYGTEYTQCIVSPNGWVGFGEDWTDWHNYGIPRVDAPKPAVFGFWTDLDPLQGGNVYYHSNPDRIVIWYDHVIHWPGDNNGTYDFQIVLYSNGDIQMNYRQMEGDINLATIGIQNANGSSGLQVVYNNNYVHSNLSIQYKSTEFLPDWLSILSQTGSLQGEIMDGETIEFTIEANSTGLSVGSYSAAMNITTNAQSTVNIPVNLIVDENANQMNIVIPHFDGWNLIGLPVQVDDANYLTIFPDAVQNTMYSYNGVYLHEQELIPGVGYMLRWNTPGSDIVTGLAVGELTISLEEGWSLISGISFPVNINNIGDPEGIIIPNTLYAYDEGYINATVVEPGIGYWIRTGASGDITLSAGTPSSKIVAFVNRMEGFNSITFSVKDGKNSTLYFNVDIPEAEQLSYSLPPKPPAGSFDVRFSGNWKYCKDSGEIEVMTDSEILSISYDVKDDENWLLINSNTGKEYFLRGGGDMIIQGELNHFELTKMDVTSIPDSYALYPNYPNPFNPVTTIRFDLPATSEVNLVIYDILGREAERLIDGDMTAGSHTIIWDASEQSSGVYFMEIHAGDFHSVRKLLLMK